MLHWLIHVLGLDSASSVPYLAWSGVVGTSVLGGVAAGIRWLVVRHHREQLALAVKHHKEQLAQRAEHHRELKAQADRHHQQRLDQADTHHEALKAHISAQTPTTPVAELPAQPASRSRKTGGSM